ncbi:molecular chaperone [Photobacterium sp. TY1-4]|uniref:molecular chaperone n=1 Tax=Photobacterium sp. TY1-4 TaxID=2899122 RepID=UPI0021BE1C36|nr:molecular chaperone [Photobacterium sp. TY1-4]UXI00043.1 molecular chaperone [Photobacterium sp. TY1-4]
MYIGFDYGTANCSVAMMAEGNPVLLPLEGGSHYIPSTLCAPSREAVSEYLYRHMGVSPRETVGEQLLRRSIAMNREEGIDVEPGDMRFGQAALDLYLDDPEEVYYVKSAKSFLGANGLQAVQISFFEDLVCAMMHNIKTQAEQTTQQAIEHAVIGRPVNFQGTGGEQANRQAEGILRQAAERAGFREIEFQFEPVAAGLDYESTLTDNKTVLVVDIGGGTTDCSMIQMGPDWCGKIDRQASLLGHTGLRVGGNDLDIHLAFRQLMPLLGLGSQNQKGIDLPVSQFWNPIAINNIAAQTDFYSAANYRVLEQLLRDAADPDKLRYLLRVHQETLGYQLVRKAEECKIALSEQMSNQVVLDGLSTLLTASVSQQDMAQAIESPRVKISQLVTEVIEQSSTKPDVVYLTGGTARSPVLRASIESLLPGVPLVSGNYFGSVTAGLARWAERCFA